ncbi:MAG TPA: TfoX/Sxy family protein [Capsulimonadaceae bacterium]|nr:TfoX/Sxy family protein [Capsulimonadaceae bacterium]
MSYDEEQAEKIRRTLKRLPLDQGEELSERKMFGGLCFLLNGKMLMGVGKDRIMLRLDANEYQNALRAGFVTPMDFTGKPLANFAYLSPSVCVSDDRLLEWAQKSLRFVRENMLAKPEREVKRETNSF